MLPLLIGGAALGLAKGYGDQQNEKKDRQVASATARYSPWTGMKPQEVKRADMLGSGMQGAMGGAMLGQAMGGSAPAAAGAAAGGPGTVDGTTGAIGPLSDSTPYAGTPAGAAAQGGNFQGYADKSYFQPWMGVQQR